MIGEIPFQEFCGHDAKGWQTASAEPNTPRLMVLYRTVQYYMTAKVAFIVPRTRIFVASTKRHDSAILKMVVMRRTSEQLWDEDFFFSVSRLALSTATKTLLEQLD